MPDSEIVQTASQSIEWINYVPLAVWVTIIAFAVDARRSLKSLLARVDRHSKILKRHGRAIAYIRGYVQGHDEVTITREIEAFTNGDED